MAPHTSAAASDSPKMHALARAGFDFSGANGLYDRARPSYPPSSIHAIFRGAAEGNQDGGGIRIVELGSGTGICSRMLLSPPPLPDVDAKDAELLPPIVSLTAVEPSEGMRRHFAENVLGRQPFTNSRADKIDLRCVEGTFEDIQVEDGSADAVVVAQAWHWCMDHEKALTSIARVLRPGGLLALMWNMEDRDASAWVASVRDAYEPYEGGTPQYRLGLWRDMYSAKAIAAFDILPSQHVSRKIPTTEQGVVDRVMSKSYVSVLDEREKGEVEAKVREIVRKGEGKVWIDEGQGVFEYPYQTDLILLRKKEVN